MPIILVCGDPIKVEKFVKDFSEHFENAKIYTKPFSEALSDVSQNDPKGNNLITSAIIRSERYMAFCVAKKSNTKYLNVFLSGNLPNELDPPEKSVRHDNPLISSPDYTEKDKITIFELIDDILAKKSKKKEIYKKFYSPDTLNFVSKIFKDIQSKYPYDEEIALETENIMMTMLKESNQKINVEIVYEEILVRYLKKRGLITE
ncbi:hypothetical protein M153_2710006104 [Pseudoloma neurophilia]|uniref:Uncharacterized protein n=1 Tax=Pseudoloma neurophilia TaxID=146866 RepID=A0A0R0M4F8_9MICR|nr:hypothetical protein M153_2710006104 [Pseudoloma neurophilia]